MINPQFMDEINYVSHYTVYLNQAELDTLNRAKDAIGKRGVCDSSDYLAIKAMFERVRYKITEQYNKPQHAAQYRMMTDRYGKYINPEAF